MGVRFTPAQARNEWLAELLRPQRDLLTRFWIEDIRADNIPSYHAVPDELLLQELPPTVDSMIHAFETGDVEGPRRHSIGVIRRRLAQGFRLPDLQMSLHSLETAVMRIVKMADVGLAKEYQALWSASNMYFQIALIAAEVYEQLRIEQQRRFTTAYELGITLNQILDLKAVLDTAVREVAEHMEVDATAITLAGPKGPHDQVRAYYGLDPLLAESIPGICTALGCSKEAVDTRNSQNAACSVPDLRGSDPLGPWSEMLTTRRYLSLTCVPLLAKQTYLGSLALLRKEVHDASDLERGFLYALANHIANAVQNAILYEDAQGKRELGILLEASKLFASSLDTQDVLRKIARIATEAVRADLAVVSVPGNAHEDTHHFAEYAVGKQGRSALRHIAESVNLGELKARQGGLLQEFAGPEPLLVCDYAQFAGRQESLVGTIGSALAVPLRFKGAVIGTLTLISLDKDAYSQSNISLTVGLADLAAVAVENARLYEYERNIAQTLQRSFLPSSLPDIAGYDISAFYRPAMAEAQVGGDFYDVFQATDGDVGIVIGDVSGKGLNAAVQTAMGKYMIRAYAAENLSPGDILTRFNRAFCEYAPEGVFLTVFFAVLDPEDNLLTYASAGHNPPLLYTGATGFVTQVAVAGTCIGVIEDAEYANTRMLLAPGDALLLYTDGATDVKEDGSRLDVEGLQRLFLASVHAPARRIVRSVFEGVSEFGHGRLTDDVALVALKRLGQSA